MKMHDICTNHQGREKPFNQCKGREIPFRVVNVAKITQKLAFSIWVSNLYLSRVAGIYIIYIINIMILSMILASPVHMKHPINDPK